ncbi:MULTISPECIES: hypothetical protein [unclassified Pseudoxanthomonas]|uniref:hypothetical protein n=1 Tax=unclassified Pseudoxanthomonas TaxID=2645906 RepID=UPI003076C59F
MPLALISWGQVGDIQEARQSHQHHGKTIIMVTHDPLAAVRAKRQLHRDKERVATSPHSSMTAMEREA